jgi:hypothetical protein
MKKFIIFASCFSVILFAGFSNENPKPTNLVASEVTSDKSAMANKCTFYFAPIIEKASEYEADDTVQSYKHCEKCQAGVYLEKKDGVISCTYCGDIYINNND